MLYACAWTLSRRYRNEHDMSYSLADLLSVSISVFYLLPIILYAVTGELFHLIVWIGYLLLVVGSEQIKHHVIGTRSPRPPGARDCNLWCNNGPQAGRPGMPSTHAAKAMYLSLLYGMHPWIKERPIARLLLFVYAAAVIYSRYEKRCHTPIQLLTGGLLGSAAAATVMRFI